MNQFLRFCIVGAIGFLIDAGILQALVVGMDSNPYGARIISFLAAASGTWLLNRRYTFAVDKKPKTSEWLYYMACMVLGALVNYGAYAFSITSWDIIAKQPWLGVAIGSIAGLGVNFATSRMLFRRASMHNDTKV